MGLPLESVDSVIRESRSYLPKKVQVIKFHPRHMKMVKPDANEQMLDLAEYAADPANGHAYTACLLGVPIACAGMAMQRAGMVEVWAMFSPLFKSMPLTLYRTVKVYFERTIEVRRPTRVYCVVDPNDAGAVNFMAHLKIKGQRFVMRRHIYELSLD